ncbi:MAG: hypothetical protein OEY14_03005 [Myxococcales bacterium]|nr:hypothetical protein [Myxococcales bacterium]
MADEPTKPRKIKNLKARLGRTITPNQRAAGAAGPLPPPSVGGPGGVVPPPGGLVPPPGGLVPPPGGLVPPAGGAMGIPGAGGIVAPPFGQPEPAPQPGSDDPFASQGGEAVQQVRLVIDDQTTVTDEEAGRKKSGKSYLLIGLGVLLGLIIGWGLGSTMGERRLYNRTVVDAKAIYDDVRASTDEIAKARRHINAAVTASTPGAGRTARVDYEAIEALVAMAQPFSAENFSQRQYGRLDAEAVNGLFDYAGKVTTLWERFTTLSTLTAGEERRRALDEAAGAVDDLSAQTGCVPISDDDGFRCGMVYVTFPEPEEGQPPSTTVQVRPTRGRGQAHDKTVFAGTGLEENPSSFVILTDTARSLGVLGQRASTFSEFRAELLGVKALMDETIQVQGRLEQAVGRAARLDEIPTL